MPVSSHVRLPPVRTVSTPPRDTPPHSLATLGRWRRDRLDYLARTTTREGASMPTQPSTPSTAGLRAVCARIIAALKSGETPAVTQGEVECFTSSAIEGDPEIIANSLKEVLQTLTSADLPTFERAVVAIDADERAWLGFKIVTPHGRAG
jgi:hypothetical protein